MSKFIYASPNEEQYMNALEEKHKRLQRLQQVRRQDKENAIRRRQKYKKATGQEWAHIIVDLKSKWSVSKEQELERLLQIEAKARTQMGIAMNSASEQEEWKKKEIARFRLAVIENQSIEDHRFLQSIKENRMTEHRQEEPILAKKTLQRRVAEKEHERALRAAAAYRARVAEGLVTNIEIPHHPVGRREVRKDGRPGFDETCYHRDFAVIKCENVRDADQLVDAWDAAKAAEENHRLSIEQRKKRIEQMDQNMSQRHQRALKGMVMDQQRLDLDKEMAGLLIDDRRRRRENAGDYASVFRTLYTDVGDLELARRFETKFNIEEDGKLESKPAPPRELYRKQHTKPLSPENSIEFVKADAPLKVHPGRTAGEG